MLIYIFFRYKKIFFEVFYKKSTAEGTRTPTDQIEGLVTYPVCLRQHVYPGRDSNPQRTGFKSVMFSSFITRACRIEKFIEGLTDSNRNVCFTRQMCYQLHYEVPLVYSLLFCAAGSTRNYKFMFYRHSSFPGSTA